MLVHSYKRKKLSLWYPSECDWFGKYTTDFPADVSNWWRMCLGRLYLIALSLQESKIWKNDNAWQEKSAIFTCIWKEYSRLKLYGTRRTNAFQDFVYCLCENSNRFELRFRQKLWQYVSYRSMPVYNSKSFISELLHRTISYRCQIHLQVAFTSLVTNSSIHLLHLILRYRYILTGAAGCICTGCFI